jgi:hypothetical protein
MRIVAMNHPIRFEKEINITFKEVHTLPITSRKYTYILKKRRLPKESRPFLKLDFAIQKNPSSSII